MDSVWRRGRVGAVLALVRWPNTVLAAAGVIAGAAWASGSVRPTMATVDAAAAIACLAAFANAWNDYTDREVDAAAHPRRPVPSGWLGPRDAMAVATSAGCVAFALSLLVRPAMGAATALLIAIILGYSRLKAHHGLAANVLVAVIASLPFLYGAWAVGHPVRGLPLLAIAVPLHLAREVAKDLDDAPAEARLRRTLPIAAGASVARRVVVAATVVALIPFAALTMTGRVTLAWAAIPAILLCAYAARAAAVGRRGSPQWYKWGMASAVAALLVTTLLASPTG